MTETLLEKLLPLWGVLALMALEWLRRRASEKSKPRVDQNEPPPIADPNSKK